MGVKKDKHSRHVKLLNLLGQGYTQRRAARTLGVCLDTVKRDLKEIADDNGFEEVNTPLLIDFAAREGWFGRSPKNFTGTLTERERQVLSLAAQGLTNYAIARELYLGLSTVKDHLAKAYDKIGAKNRSHAVNLARQYGLVD